MHAPYHRAHLRACHRLPRSPSPGRRRPTPSPISTAARPSRRDGHRSGRQLRPLRPHHRPVSVEIHPGQSDHHHGAHAGRRRGDRRQPHLRRRAAGRHQDAAVARHHPCREARADRGTLRNRQDAVARRLRRDHPGARDVAHRAGAEHRGSQDQGRRGDRLVCPRAPDLPLGFAAQGRDRRQVQDHHRAAHRQRQQPRHGARRNSRLDRLPGRT